MDIDGTSFDTLISKGSQYQNTFLLLRSKNNEIFGAYLSEALQVKYHDFYGTAETFVFTFYDTNRIRVFNSTKINEYYIFVEPEKIAFGCSGGNFAISLENNFQNCFTGNTSTFNNPPLCKEDNNNIVILNCELWTFSV